MNLLNYLYNLYLLIESVITEKILLLMNGMFFITKNIKYLIGYRTNILFEKKLTRKSVKSIKEIMSKARSRKYFNEKNLRSMIDKRS